MTQERVNAKEHQVAGCVTRDENGLQGTRRHQKGAADRVAVRIIFLAINRVVGMNAESLLCDRRTGRLGACGTASHQVGYNAVGIRRSAPGGQVVARSRRVSW